MFPLYLIAEVLRAKSRDTAVISRVQVMRFPTDPPFSHSTCDRQRRHILPKTRPSDRSKKRI